MTRRRMLSNGRSGVRQLAMLVAIGLALHAQLALHRAMNDLPAWIELVIAVVLAAWAAGPAAQRGGALVPAADLPRARLYLAAAALVPVFMATYLGATARLPLLALALWAAAPLLASLALRGWQVTPARRQAIAWDQRELAAVAAVVVVGALARTLWVGSLPREYFGDEPRVAMFLALAYRDGAVPNFFSMGWNTWPVVGLSLQGLFVPVLGLHVWVLRLSSALMGTLAVLLTYLLARELFSRRTALAAAFLFAICRTAIDFSRLGVSHAQILFFEPLALYLFWRAVDGGRAATYVWAGVATALCLYSYNAGQLVPLLIFGWAAVLVLADRRLIRTHWRGAALLAAAFAATLLPYLYHFTDGFTFGANWGQWTIMARNRQTLGEIADAWRGGGLAAAWNVLWRQIWMTWMGFGVLPGGEYGLGYRRGGMLDDVSAALFVIGLAIALRRVRRASNAFLVFWWLVTVVAGGIMTVGAPSFVRMVGLLPALAIFAALPLAWLWQPARDGGYRLAAVGVAVALALAAAWQNYRTYFVDFAATTANPVSELARYVETLPPDVHIALLGAEHFLQYTGELSRIEFPGRGRDIAEPSHFVPLHEPIDAPLAIVLTPTQVTLSEYLQTLYPSAAVETPLTGAGTPGIFRSVVVQPEEARRRTGLGATAQRADGSTSAVAESDPFASRIDIARGTDRVAWRGRVYWPYPRPLQVTVNAGQPSTIRFGDAPPLVADGLRPATATITLPRGWQPVEIVEAAAPRRRLAITLAMPTGNLDLTRWDFRPESQAEGLVGRYVLQDATSIHAIDPQLNAFAVEDRFSATDNPLVRMPFRATWRGALRIDTPGTYTFEAIGSGPYDVQLDGARLLAGAPEKPEEPKTATVEKTLTAGLHPIAVDFDSTKSAHTTRRIFQLLWTPPGGAKALIPPTNFVPTSSP